MKILLIPDKFKGSLTAKEVVAAIKTGLRSVDSGIGFTQLLASDGGDGFLNSVAENVPVRRCFDGTIDPLGRKIKGEYLLSEDGQKAYIELAKASGLELLTDHERNIMHASTLGTGYQIDTAIEQGAKEVYVGLGGSATNDAGIGIAHALGYAFFDGNGKRLDPSAKNLSRIEKIDPPKNRERLESVSFFAVNDVDNPLYGRNGAAHVYGAQKGADPKEIETLDLGLRHLSETVIRELNKDNADLSGAGAAGGTAYGLSVFLDASFISGIHFILGLSGVEGLLKEEKFDYIITGEGKFDDQTLHGKLIKGVVDLGRQFDIPIIVVCGKAEVDALRLQEMGLEAVLEIADPTKSLEHNMAHASDLLESTIAKFFKKRV